jgi:hypothetical protein
MKSHELPYKSEVGLVSIVRCGDENSFASMTGFDKNTFEAERDLSRKKSSDVVRSQWSMCIFFAA